MSASAPAEESFRLKVGESATVADGALQVAFEAVESDARCPKGETCVSEGDAIVVVSARAAGEPEARVRLHTAAKSPVSADYLDWNIRLLTLEPYPVTGKGIPASGYVATLVVTRRPADPDS